MIVPPHMLDPTKRQPLRARNTIMAPGNIRCESAPLYYTHEVSSTRELADVLEHQG